MATAFDFSTVNPVITVTYIDNNGNRATTTHYTPAGTTFAGATAQIANLAADLDAVTIAEIEKVTLSWEAPNTAAVAPPANSNVKDKLKLTFFSSHPRSLYSYEVPSPNTSAEQIGTDVANQAQVELAALIDETLTGNWGPANGMVTATGFDLTGLKSAFFSVRNREPNR